MQNNLDKYGLIKVKNPNGKFLRNIILGLCMLLMSFGGFAFTSLLPKKVSEVEAATEGPIAKVYSEKNASDYEYFKYLPEAFDYANNKLNSTSDNYAVVELLANFGTEQVGKSGEVDVAGYIYLTAKREISISWIGTTAYFNVHEKAHLKVGTDNGSYIYFQSASSSLQLEGPVFILQGDGVIEFGNGTYIQGLKCLSTTSGLSPIMVESGGVLNITGGIYEGNGSSSNPNGGLIRNNGGSINISGGKFIGNSAQTGGVIFNDGGRVEISGGTFEENYGQGAAVYNAGIVGILDNAQFVNNGVTGSYGRVYRDIVNDSKGRLYVMGGIFKRTREQKLDATSIQSRLEQGTTVSNAQLSSASIINLGQIYISGGEFVSNHNTFDIIQCSSKLYIRGGDVVASIRLSLNEGNSLVQLEADISGTNSKYTIYADNPSVYEPTGGTLPLIVCDAIDASLVGAQIARFDYYLTGYLILQSETTRFGLIQALEPADAPIKYYMQSSPKDANYADRLLDVSDIVNRMSTTKNDYAVVELLQDTTLTGYVYFNGYVILTAKRDIKVDIPETDSCFIVTKESNFKIETSNGSKITFGKSDTRIGIADGLVQLEPYATLNIGTGTLFQNIDCYDKAPLFYILDSTSPATINITGGEFINNQQIGIGRGTIVMLTAKSQILNISGGPVFKGNKSLVGDCYGGVIFAVDSSEVNISGGYFGGVSNEASVEEGNSAGKYGGVIFAAGQSTINITGGEFRNNSATNGGVIALWSYCGANISGGYFYHNLAQSGEGYGGAIAVRDNSQVTISGSAQFIYNLAMQGGAISTNLGSQVKILGGVFAGNESSGGYAGAIFSIDSKLEISGGRFEGNRARTSSSIQESKAGAIYFSGSSDTSKQLIISGATFFTLNYASYGGAIYAKSEDQNWATTISGATFQGNGASSSTYGGGAIYASDFSITDCLFICNYACEGGAVYANGYSASISKSVFTDNAASKYNGGAIYNQTLLKVIGCEFNNTQKVEGYTIYDNVNINIEDVVFDGNDNSIRCEASLSLGGSITNTGYISLASNETIYVSSKLSGSGQYVITVNNLGGYPIDGTTPLVTFGSGITVTPSYFVSGNAGYSVVQGKTNTSNLYLIATSDAVARVYTQSAGTSSASYFASLDEAITYANSLTSTASNNTVIDVLKDITISSSVTDNPLVGAGKYITLTTSNTSGVTITRSIDTGYKINGTLNISSSAGPITFTQSSSLTSRTAFLSLQKQTTGNYGITLGQNVIFKNITTASSGILISVAGDTTDVSNNTPRLTIDGATFTNNTVGRLISIRNIGNTLVIIKNTDINNNHSVGANSLVGLIATIPANSKLIFQDGIVDANSSIDTPLFSVINASTGSGTLEITGGVFSNNSINSNESSGTSSNDLKNGLINNYGTLKITGGKFTRNNAKYGVINNKSITSSSVTYTGTTTISGGAFRYNNSKESGGAGVIYVASGIVNITDGEFTENYAIENGVIYNAGTVNISGGTFTGNSADEAGVIRNDNGNLTISGSVIFRNNSADNSPVLYNLGTATISGNAIFENNLEAGLYCDITNEGTLNVNGGTFKRSLTDVTDGYSLYHVGGTLTVTAGTFSGNGMDIYHDGSALNLAGSDLILTICLASGKSATVTSAYKTGKYTITAQEPSGYALDGTTPLVAFGSGITADPNYFVITNDGYTIVQGKTNTSNLYLAQDITLTFNSNDTTAGTVSKSSLSVPYGSTISINNNVLTINGNAVTASAKTTTDTIIYTFTGWTVSGSSLVNGTVVTTAMTITANFTKTANQYTLTVNPNGGSTYKNLLDSSTISSNSSGTGNICSYTYDATTGIYTMTPTKAGDTFFYPTARVSLTAGKTYAFHVVLMDNNGKVLTSYGDFQIFYYCSADGINETKAVHFKNGGGGFVKMNQPIATTGVYQFRFDGDHNNSAVLKIGEFWVVEVGSESTSSQTYSLTYANRMQIPTPTRTGYTFAGWTLSGTGSTISSNNQIFTMGSANATLTAKWTANALTFNDQTLNSGTYGTAYTSNAFTGASNGTGSYTYTIVSGAPTGASINSTNRTISFTNTTSAGTYKVVVRATDNGSKVTKDATMTIVINKANATVTAPTAKTLTYNGSAQALVNAGSATGGTLQYKLNSSGTYSTTIPTAINAGSYTVYYKVVGDSNHNDVAEKSVTVTIGKKSVAVSWTNTSFTYDGNAHKPTASVSSGITGETINLGTVSVSQKTNGTALVNGEAKNVGTYGASVTMASVTGGQASINNYTLTSNTADFTIAQRAIAVPTASATTFTYNAQSQTYTPANWSSISSYANISGNTRTTAGSQTVTVSLKDKTNNKWSDGTTTDKTFTFTINQKEVTITWPTTNTFTYDGSAKSYTATIGGVISGDTVSFSYTNSGTKVTSATNVGSYTAEISGLSGTSASNYKLPSSGKSHAWSIGKATLSTPTNAVWSTSARGTATWTASKAIAGITITYKVELFKSGSTTAVDTQTVSGTSYNFASKIRTSGAETYTFKVTAISSNTANANNSGSAQSDKLYAVLVTAKAGTGIASATIGGASSYVMINGESVAVSATAKTGYAFSGFTSSDTARLTVNSATKVTLGANITSTSPITLTANAKANTFVVTVNANGGTISATTGWTVASDNKTATKSVTYDSTYGTLPTPTKAGFEFLGWFTDGENGTQITADSKVTITSNQTLYAHWKAKLKITIKIDFDDNCDNNILLVVKVYNIKTRETYSYSVTKSTTIALEGLEPGLYKISFVTPSQHTTLVDGNTYKISAVLDTDVTWNVTISKTSSGGFGGRDTVD